MFLVLLRNPRFGRDPICIGTFSVSQENEAYKMARERNAEVKFVTLREFKIGKR